MTKFEALILAIQTGAIVKDIHDGRSVSEVVVASAYMSIDESKIQPLGEDDFMQAARDFLDYQYQSSTSKIEKPWFVK